MPLKSENTLYKVLGSGFGKSREDGQRVKMLRLLVKNREELPSTYKHLVEKSLKSMFVLARRMSIFYENCKNFTSFSFQEWCVWVAEHPATICNLMSLYKIVGTGVDEKKIYEFHDKITEEIERWKLEIHHQCGNKKTSGKPRKAL